MSVIAGSTLWGDWVLGDLADSIRMVADALGPSASVTSISVTVPTPDDPVGSLPTVRVTTSSEGLHSGLRTAILNGEYDVDAVFEPTDSHWSGFVGGIYLVLMVKELDR